MRVRRMLLQLLLLVCCTTAVAQPAVPGFYRVLPDSFKAFIIRALTTDDTVYITPYVPQLRSETMYAQVDSVAATLFSHLNILKDDDLKINRAVSIITYLSYANMQVGPDDRRAKLVDSFSSQVLGMIGDRRKYNAQKYRLLYIQAENAMAFLKKHEATAVENLHECFLYYKATGDSANMVVMANGLTAINLGVYHISEAIHWAAEAVRYLPASDPYYKVNRTQYLNCLAGVYLHGYAADTSRSGYLVAAKEIIDRIRLEGYDRKYCGYIVLLQRAEYAYYSRNFPAARRYVDSAARYLRMPGMLEGYYSEEAYYLLKLKIYERSGDHSGAKKIAEEWVEKQIPKSTYLYSFLYEDAVKNKQWKQAADFLYRSSELGEAGNTRSAGSEIFDITQKFNALSKEKAIADLKAEKRQLIVNALIVFLLTVLVFGLILNSRKLRVVKTKMQYIQKLNDMEKVLVEQELAMVTSKQELSDERRQIGRKLHDTFSNSLISLKYLIRDLQRQPRGTADLLSVIQEELDAIYAEAREYSHLLAKDEVDSDADRDLVKWIQKICEQFDALNLLHIHANLSDDSWHRLGATQKNYLFYITKECFANTIKHARSENIRLHLSQNGTSCTFTYQDDGVGFSPKAVTNGLGFDNIREYARRLGGQIQISGDKGLELCIRFPLTEAFMKKPEYEY